MVLGRGVCIPPSTRRAQAWAVALACARVGTGQLHRLPAAVFGAAIGRRVASACIVSEACGLRYWGVCNSLLDAPPTQHLDRRVASNTAAETRSHAPWRDQPCPQKGSARNTAAVQANSCLAAATTRWQGACGRPETLTAATGTAHTRRQRGGGILDSMLTLALQWVGNCY